MKLSEIDLNLLVILDAIIKERSVTRAGRHVGLSQPATSGALRRLRELFADPLIERVGGESRLTPFAISLATPLHRILGSIEHVVQRNVTFDPLTSQRSFRIAASDDVTCVVLQPLLQLMRRFAPGVTLQIQRPDRETGKRLLTRQVELAIEPAERYRGRELASARLFRDEWSCVVWSGNKSIGRELTREQFLNAGHVTYSMPPYGFTMVDRFLGAQAQAVKILVMTDSFVSLPMLLRGTDLIALVQSRLGALLAQAADVRLLRPPIELHDLVFNMWWPPLFEQDPAHTWLRETLLELSQTLNVWSAAEERTPRAI